MLKKLRLFFGLLLIANISAAHEVPAPTILYSKESPFGLIEVVSYPGLDDLNICENKDYSQTHSIIRQDDPTYMGTSYAPLSTVSFCFAKKLTNILLLGLGGGEFLSYFVKYFPDSNVDIVEINPVMIDIVKNFRKIKVEEARVNFICEDAFKHVVNAKKRYDLIFCDLYFFEPPVADHYLNFFENVKRSLNEGGVVIFNGIPSEVPQAVMRDLFSKFENIAVLDAQQGNVEFFCYNGPAKTKDELKLIAKQLQEKHQFRYSLSEMCENIQVLATDQKVEWINQFKK